MSNYKGHDLNPVLCGLKKAQYVKCCFKPLQSWQQELDVLDFSLSV